MLLALGAVVINGNPVLSQILQESNDYFSVDCFTSGHLVRKKAMWLWLQPVFFGRVLLLKDKFWMKTMVNVKIAHIPKTLDYQLSQKHRWHHLPMCMVLSWKGTNPWKKTVMHWSIWKEVWEEKRKEFPWVSEKENFGHQLEIAIYLVWMVYVTQMCHLTVLRGLCPLSINNGFLAIIFSEWNSPRS